MSDRSSADRNEHGTDSTMPAPPVAPKSRPSAEAVAAFPSNPQPVDELPPPSVNADDLIGELVAERYRVVRVVGRGATGTVLVAEHVHMRKPVAIKVLHPDLCLEEEVVGRFEREAIAAGRIEDPHVVAAMDFGRLPNGALYLVLEYVEGLGLERVLEAGRMSPARALRIIRQIVEALVAAHAAGIVHRDLKPENVMLVARGSEVDYVKVLDFGIAKMPDTLTAGPALTRAGRLYGTPTYMSPEQAIGGTVDARADLYAVGVIAYELLTGSPPFVSDELTRVLAMQIGTPAPALPDNVPVSLRALVATQLEKDPARRTQSAEELLEWCDVVLRELGVAPVPARPELDSSLIDLTVSPLQPLQPRPSAIQQLLAKGRESAHVGGVVVPVWLLFGVAFALVLVPAATVLIVVLALRAGTAPTTVVPSATVSAAPRSGPSSTSGSTLEPGMEALLARATTGDAEAVAELEQRPPAKRSVQEWLALGRGRYELKRYPGVLEAYGKVVEREPKLASDRLLVAHVGICMRIPTTAEEAIQLAARKLGSAGVDLLYDLWVSTPEKTATTQLARQLAYDKDVRRAASQEVQIALDLRAALESENGCVAVQGLLSRATLHGDLRSYFVLEKLRKKSGCGPRSLDDCYPCLRADGALEDALLATKRRQAPLLRP